MPVPAPPRHRVAATLGALALILGLLAGIPVAEAAAAAPQTRVSLTFDDSNADQFAAAQTMKAAGLRGTFYTVSGFVDAPNYLTRTQLAQIAADGNEIGGHSVTHPDLTTLPTAEATRQICNDRVNLTDWGFQVTSFAYPFAAATTATESIARQCGYNSARGLGDLRSRFGCAGCPYAESTPPADPYYTKAVDEVDSTWTLADLQAAVTNAETRNGGWVQLTFHHVCSGCDPLAVSPTVFGQFVSWLAPRAASHNTVVQTVGQVIGGPVRPAVAGPAVAPAPPGSNAVRNPSLETLASGTSSPQCWMAGGYGTNTPTFTTLSGGASAHSGSRAERISVSGYSSGDAKYLPTLDLGGCSPTVTPDHTYSLRTWYKATGVTQFAVYYRTGVGTWVYWTSSPWFAASASWAQATWTTPPVPAGATGLSFGLSQFSNGTLTIDDSALYDSAGAPPVAAVAVPAAVAASTTSPGGTTPSAGTLQARMVRAPAGAVRPAAGGRLVGGPGPVDGPGPAYGPGPAEPVGPAAHRDRDQRRGPVREIFLLPGPDQVRPGTALVVGQGPLTG